MNRKLTSKRTISRLQITLVVVCVCFFAGIVTGALSEYSLSSEQAAKLINYRALYEMPEMDFSKLFIKHGKYIFAIWLSGFVLPGSIIVMIIIFTIGIFYGFSAAFAVQSSGMSYVIANIFPQNAILIPLYIFTAVWTIMFVLKKYSNNGPKSRIKREQRKGISEHSVILAICLLCNSIVCLVEIYMSQFIGNITK